MKKRLPLTQALRLINSKPVALLTSAYKDKYDVMALGWYTPMNFNPPMVGIMVAPSRFSYELIERSNEFALNIPRSNLIYKIDYCGRVTGANIDKFVMSKLHQQSPIRVNVPLVRECVAHLECSVTTIQEFKDHALIIGEIIAAQVEEEMFDDFWRLDDPEADVQLLHHLGSDFYYANAETRKADLTTEN